MELIKIQKFTNHLIFLNFLFNKKSADLTLNQSKGVFSYFILSHEMKNPIQLQAELIRVCIKQKCFD